MIEIIGIAAFFMAIFFCYKAVRNFFHFRDGIQTTATILHIEQTREELYNYGRFTIKYWLHLELPPFQGQPLGKKYDYPIDPKRYKVGENLAIIQQKDFPTDIIILKETTFLDMPKPALIIGILLFLLSYTAC